MIARLDEIVDKATSNDVLRQISDRTCHAWGGDVRSAIAIDIRIAVDVAISVPFYFDFTDTDIAELLE